MQGSIISTLLYDLYIKELINELDGNSFYVLAYVDYLCVLSDSKNQLINILNIINKLTK